VSPGVRREVTGPRRCPTIFSVESAEATNAAEEWATALRIPSPPSDMGNDANFQAKQSMAMGEPTISLRAQH
jgi:hypothetical protein